MISADKIILNKTDLLNNNEKIEQLKFDIKNLNPLADIVQTNYSKIPFEYLFEESKNSPFNTLNDNTILNSEEQHGCSSCKDTPCDINQKKTCTHLSLMENFVVTTKIENLEEIDKRVGKLVWDISAENNFHIIRFKGILRIKDEENKIKFMSLQGLYDLYEFTEIKISENNNLSIDSQKGSFRSKILFIGKNLNKNKTIIEEILN